MASLKFLSAKQPANPLGAAMFKNLGSLRLAAKEA